MANRSVARAADDPPWVEGLEEQAPQPSGVFVRTYEAIASADGPASRRRSSWIPPLRRLVVVGALALGGLAVRQMLLAPVPDESATVRTRVVDGTPAPSGPALLGAVPVAPKASVRIGRALDFAVVASGGDLRFGWTVDGTPAGTGPRWTYVPAPDAVGRHRVEVSVGNGRTRSQQAWLVRVQPARPPRILAAQPAREVIEVTSGDPVKLTLGAEPATPDEHLRTTWTVDGMPAGEGGTLTLQPPRPGIAIVRAVVTSDLGATASHDWRLHVLEPPAPPPAVPTPAATAPAPPARLAAPTQRALASPPATGEDDVRHWLERYAAAWRARDVEALRRMGQVTTDDEVAALRRYFDRVRDLDVELDLLAIDVRGEGAVVRFVRRDRFRDPAGRLVMTESPPIEKQLVRTSDGLRVVRAGPPA